MPKLPKITSLLFLCNMLRKNWVMKLIFCMQISMKDCYKLITKFWWGWSNTLGIKVSYNVDIIIVNGHEQAFQITQSNKFAISLQYLIKEVRNGGHFWHADKRQSFYKLVLSFLMEVTRHVQNTQNRKLVIFLQYIKKNCHNCFVFYCDAKYLDILQGSVMFVVTCFSCISINMTLKLRSMISQCI